MDGPRRHAQHRARLRPRPGGGYRISLTYDVGAPGAGTGKTSAQTDTFRARFVELVPDARVVETVAFETDDPRMQGEMRITIELAESDGGSTTELSAVHDHLPRLRGRQRDRLAHVAGQAREARRG